MLKVIKIMISCAFAETEKIRYVEVDDSLWDYELSVLVERYMFNDIKPVAFWEDSSYEEAEEAGMEVEKP